MWRRQLLILPNWLLFPLSKVNIFLNKFISGGNYHMIGFNNITAISTNSDRDIHNLIEKFQPHISFTKEEEIKGKKILSDFGIPEHAKFVCLIARDSAYLDRAKDLENLPNRFDYHRYRDGDIDKFIFWEAVAECCNRIESSRICIVQSIGQRNHFFNDR